MPPNARACPECGADERTGWNEDSTRCDGLDLPEEAFEDDAEKKRSPGKTVPIFWWVVGIGLTAILVCALLGVRF